MESHLLSVCKSAACKSKYFQVQLTEHIFARQGEDVDKVLSKRGKYRQAQCFTWTHELNNINEWYALNRQG